MRRVNDVDEDWRRKQALSTVHRSLTMTDAGLILGRETILPIAMAGAAGVSSLSVDDEANARAMLTVAYERRPVPKRTVAQMRRAVDLWRQGEKALAQLHLAFIGLPDVDECVAYRLLLAKKALEAGVSPEALIKAVGFNQTALDFEKYNRDQPRVPAGQGRESGRWTSGANNQQTFNEGRSGRDKNGLIQLADISDDLVEAMGGAPRLVITPKGATQFIGPNGSVLRFDLLPSQYGAQGPHINLQNFPGAPPNVHIKLKP